MIVRRRFRFHPPVVGSYLFCSLRHASNEFFRIRLKIRESHECCVHLLQHKTQVLHSSVLDRIRRQEPFRRVLSGPIISDSMITPAKDASVFFDHC